MTIRSPSSLSLRTSMASSPPPSLLSRISNSRVKLLLIVIAGVANLAEVLYTSRIEYYCSSQLKTIIKLNTNGDDNTGYDDNNFYYYYSTPTNKTDLNLNQCTQQCNNIPTMIQSKCTCQSQYCSLCSTCGGICFPQGSCDSLTYGSPTPAPTVNEDQCFRPLSSSTDSTQKKHKGLKAECTNDIDFTRRPFAVIVVFAVMDILKQYLYLRFQYAITLLRRSIYLILHIVTEFVEAIILFFTATWFCIQQCDDLPDSGGYRSIFAIFMVIATIQVACGPIREYFGHFEDPEIRLPAYLITRKLIMTCISDLIVGIFSFNTHKVFATIWFRYIIFIYIWIIIAGLEMVVSIRETIFDAFKSKLAALRYHTNLIYSTYCAFAWFILLLSCFTIPNIQACVQIVQQHRDLGEDCHYNNAYWLIVLIYINVLIFSIYFRYTITITNFVEERFRCLKGHRCRVIDNEMFGNLTGIDSNSNRQQKKECIQCGCSLPLASNQGWCRNILKLHNHVFEYCRKCSYFCCVDCAYKQRQSEYYLYGVLWRKKSASIECDGDDYDVEEREIDSIIMRPSRRISATAIPSINPLQNDQL